MSKIFRPRRGKKTTMNGTKANTVLALGEMFVEMPDSGCGTGPCKIKLGDGVTTYNNLSYALGDTPNNTIEYSENSATTLSAALESATSGSLLKTIVAALRKSVSILMAAVTQADITTALTAIGTKIDNGLIPSFPASTYFYDKTTGITDATTLKRYKKVGTQYFECLSDGSLINGTAVTVTESNLIAYVKIADSNLSAGFAGYTNNSLVLGSGADNINKRMPIIIKLGSFSTGYINTTKSYNYNIANYLPSNYDISKLSSENFFPILTAGAVASDSQGNDYSVGRSYNKSTGIATIIASGWSTSAGVSFKVDVYCAY